MNKQDIEIIGDNHISSSVETPMLSNAFNTSDDEKIKTIQHHFGKIMETLGLDLSDDSLSGTPYRFAKMYVKEIFSGLDPQNMPKPTMFENRYQYNRMLVEKNISVFSTCEHHFLPIIDKVHIAYSSNNQVIGLSKLNRIAQYYAKRPQVQERLTMQIANALKFILDTDDVAVYMDATHMCVHSRGVEDTNSSTVTSEYSGKFLNEATRAEFLSAIRS